MRSLTRCLCLALGGLLAACSSTPADRIAKHQALFAGYPAEVQQKIRAGEVDLGFTPEMVRLALGEPARTFTRQSGAGTSEVWVYNRAGPRFSFGVGVGGAVGRHSSMGVGVSSSTGGYEPDERLRVEFREGKVSAVEHVSHK